MASLFKPTYTQTDPATGCKITRRAKKWYGQLTDADGRPRRLPLSENKTAAQQMLNALVKKAELGKVGITDPFGDHRKRPLAGHLDDFDQGLRSKGNTAKHASLTTGRVRAVLDACRFVFMADLSASRFVNWLADERAAGRMGANTSNYYLRDVKSFARWLVRDGRMQESPFQHVKGMNASADVRHARRAINVTELQGILAAALESPTTFRGLTGRDRHFLYLTAMATGFRVAELASLTAESFDLACNEPTVTVKAGYAKNRKLAVQPMPIDVAEALLTYLPDRPAGKPVWPGTWTEKAARMLRIDLAAAGVAYVTEGPDGLEYADFHALRHSYITNIVASGVNVKLAQTLARHSTVTLTLGRYTHVGLHDGAAAVEHLPRLLPDAPEREILRATGTDSACTVACTKLAQTADFGCAGMTTAETTGPIVGVVENPMNSGELRADDTPCDSMKVNEGAGARTQDLRIKSPLLYRLSYASRLFCKPSGNSTEQAAQGKPCVDCAHIWFAARPPGCWCIKVRGKFSMALFTMFATPNSP